MRPNLAFNKNKSRQADAWVVNLGLTPYRQALDLQQELCFKRAYNEIPDTLLLLEHTHVYTTGRQTLPEHLYINHQEALDMGADIIQADRGGSVTYHGPGQLTAYPIIDIGPYPDLNQYLRNLEEVIIQALNLFDIQAQRISGFTGVWVENSKIASIGVKVTRGITKHGFSLNIDPDMSFFNHINACGFNRSVVSMRQLLSFSLPEWKLISKALVDSFADIFKRNMIIKSPKTFSKTKV